MRNLTISSALVGWIPTLFTNWLYVSPHLKQTYAYYVLRMNFFKKKLELNHCFDIEFPAQNKKKTKTKHKARLQQNTFF